MGNSRIKEARASVLDVIFAPATGDIEFRRALKSKGYLDQIFTGRLVNGRLNFEVEAPVPETHEALMERSSGRPDVLQRMWREKS